MMDGMHGGGTGLGMMLWMALSSLIALALLVALILVIVWLIRALFTGTRAGPSREDAESLLRRRYAAGEIDAEEFHRRHDDLQRGT